MLDRSTPPIFDTHFNLELPTVEQTKLSNGTPVYVINNGTEDTMRISFLLEVGAWHQDKPLVANFTQQMLNKGAQGVSAYDISEKFDFFGAYYTSGTGMCYSIASFYVLNKHVEQLLPVMANLLQNPALPANELNILVQNQKQNFIINQNKVSYVAARMFDKIMFGNSHPYGNAVTLDDFERIEQRDIQQFFNEKTSKAPISIMLSGKVPPNTVELLDKLLAQSNSNRTSLISQSKAWASGTDKLVKKEVEGAVQSCVKAGLLLPTRTHPDFFKFKIVNTLLGGYFGSRMMQNIREKKGYTYGIQSSIIPQKDIAMWVVTTETSNALAQKVMDEIVFEVNNLCDNGVANDELQRTKSYMFNEILRSIDQPFSYADVHQSLIEYKLTQEYLLNNASILSSITSEELQEIARKYFAPDKLQFCVAGGVE